MDRRPGQNSIGLEFAYESRFEKFSPYAHKFVWCITNKLALPAMFHWGTSKEESKYFGLLVLPQQPKDNWLTDSTGAQLDNRIIKFMPSDSATWQSISPQTYHVRESSLNNRSLLSTSESFQRVQVQFDLKESMTEYLTPDGLVDLAKLSANTPLFVDFLRREGGKVQISQGGVVTVPVNNTALEQMEVGKYTKFDPNDFASFQILVSSTITLGPLQANGLLNILLLARVDSYPESLLGGRSFELLANLPIFLSIYPDRSQPSLASPGPPGPPGPISSSPFVYRVPLNIHKTVSQHPNYLFDRGLIYRYVCCRGFNPHPRKLKLVVLGRHGLLR
jgi:hypothetical protein